MGHFLDTNSYVYIASALLLLPFGLLMLRSLYLQMIRTFEDLVLEGVLDEDVVWPPVQNMLTRLSDRKLALLVYAVAATAVIFQQYSNYEIFRNGDRAYWLFPHGRIAFETVWYVALVIPHLASLLMAAIKILVVSRTLNRVFSAGDPPNISPLHPDGCGGLASVGRLSRAINAVVLVTGLVVAFIVISKIYDGQDWRRFALLGGLGYMVVAPAIFFAPLIAVHNVMKEAKLRLLSRISARFDEEFRTQVKALDSGRTAISVAKLKELRDLYELAASNPVWPFDAASIRSLVLNVMGPVFLVLVGELIQRLMVAV